ncbi:MAG: carboxymuconolactone decarboxylase family protein [Dehalococcoidia bacterium]
MTQEPRAAEAMIAEMRRKRGYLTPGHELAARMDPEFTEAYNRLVALSNLHEGVPTEGKALPVKYRELIYCAILAHRGFEYGVKVHIRRALELGATPQELLEAFEATVICGGGPTFLMGAGALAQVLAERQQGG